MTQYVHDPVRRQRYAFQRDGDNLLVDIWVQPGGDGPPHVHPDLEERFAVLEGSVRFKAGGRTVIGRAGDELVVAPGTKHSFKNIGDHEARLRAEVRPALELQGLLEDLAEAARAGLYTRRGIPTSLRGARRVAEILQRYGDTAVAGWPPPALIRIFIFTIRVFSRARSEES